MPCHAMPSIPSHPSPGGRCWLCGLSLDPGAPHDVILHGHLHLGRDVRGRVADLHSCLQEADGPRVLELVCHAVLVPCLAVQHGQLGGEGFVPPGNPAQLPKEKHKHCHQRQATHHNDHCKEADRELWGRRTATGRGGKEEKKRQMVRRS